MNITSGKRVSKKGGGYVEIGSLCYVIISPA